MGTTLRRERSRLGRLLALAGALLLGAACGESAAPTPVLLISVDTLRADRLGAYGGDRGLTPHLDALARESVVFEAAYAPAPFTLPSVAALLTGRHPQALGVYSNESRLPGAVPTLASTLSEVGYACAAVVSNWVLRRAAGLAADFDPYDDALGERERVRGWPERSAVATTDAALRALEGCAGEPCFVWVHYQDPHGPYTPPPELRERYLPAARAAPDGARELPVLDTHSGIGGLPSYQVQDDRRDVAWYRAGYDAEVAFTDREIGRLLAVLDSSPRALVVFTADHGEALGEDDYWFAHGERLGDPLVRVPLFIRAPGVAPARRDDVASLLDVVPTLLARIPGVAPGPALRGRDLLAEGAEHANSEPYLTTLGAARPPRYGLVAGEFKLVVVTGDGAGDRLTRRGREEFDLRAAAPQVARDLRRRLDARRREYADGMPETRQMLSEADRARLRALGYAGDS